MDGEAVILLSDTSDDENAVGSDMDTQGTSSVQHGSENVTLIVSSTEEADDDDAGQSEHQPTLCLSCAVCRSRRGGLPLTKEMWTDLTSFSADVIRMTFDIEAPESGVLCKTCRVAAFFTRHGFKKKVAVVGRFKHYVNVRMNDVAEHSPNAVKNDPAAGSGTAAGLLANGETGNAKDANAAGSSPSQHTVIVKWIDRDQYLGKERATDLHECEVCGKRGMRKSFLPSGRFCSKFCLASFGRCFAIANSILAGTWRGGKKENAASKVRSTPKVRKLKPLPPLRQKMRHFKSVKSMKAGKVKKKYYKKKALTRPKMHTRSPPHLAATANTATTHLEPTASHSSNGGLNGSRHNPPPATSPQAPRQGAPWEPHYDRQKRELFLDVSRKTPLGLACLGLLPRKRTFYGDLLTKRPFPVPERLRSKPSGEWSPDDVYDYIVLQDEALSEAANTLREQAVDGEAFQLINLDELVRTLGVKLGPALKLNSYGGALCHMSMQ